MDGVWSEDFHHATRVTTNYGSTEGYYADYRGTPQELVSCVKRAFLFQGQRYQWQKKPRGTVVEASLVKGSSFISRITIRLRISCGETGCM